jgi:hypothetical protein
VNERIIVCGGRDFTDRTWLFHVLDSIRTKAGVAVIIQGGARGADRLAKQWADERGVPASTFRADWVKFGRKAGPIRNQHMIDEGNPTLVIAFPGGRGTADMLARAKEARIDFMQCSRSKPKEATGATPCPTCCGRGYYLENFADNFFTPCRCAASIGGARPVT